MRMASKIAGVSGSYNSFGSACKKNVNARACNSQQFMKPQMGLQKLAKLKDRLKEKVFKILLQARGSNDTETGPAETKDFTLDESKRIIRELATQLNRIVWTRKSSLLTKVTEDGSCPEDRQEFILKWAEELSQSTQTEETEGGKFKSSTADSVTEKPTLQKPDKEVMLKEARTILSEWAWSLKDMEQDSVCLSEDVGEVLQDLEKQWKKGKLPNMLPVMDFIIWCLLREQTQEGSVAKQWLRHKQRFRSRVALNHIPDSVWKWILKASAEITMDPSTANPCLKLSSDRKGMKMDQIIESRNNPWIGFSRRTNQFDGWWCVLGAEGYDSGRHYWEVDIRGKREWTIGVVKESAPRNGFASLNATTGYWTLRLQLRHLMAMTSPVTKLDRFAPNRLGVFLDMKEGHVSFYDAEQRCHIYTFDVNFDHTEKIYPVFGTIETDRELVILSN